jgi:hypothetical protein
MTTTKENRESWVAFWVAEFIQDSKAIQSFGRDSAHWRIELMARREFQNETCRLRDLGYLLYLHADCSLIKKGA